MLIYKVEKQRKIQLRNLNKISAKIFKLLTENI